MMLANLSPQEAYRRVDFDARVATARPDQLVSLCLEQLSISLGSAIRAVELNDNHRKSAGLTRALAALTALQLGVDRAAPGAAALLQFYAAVRQAVLDSVPSFDPARLRQVRLDVEDVAEALSK
ncbi:MAG: flagellar protein FliS [Novosphingobium sp.]|jgi:flagellar protein FliS|nr:flagellar protein FliS [Novosphingobium sp.]